MYTDLSKEKCEEQSDEILYPPETRDFFREFVIIAGRELPVPVMRLAGQRVHPR